MMAGRVSRGNSLGFIAPPMAPNPFPPGGSGGIPAGTAGMIYGPTGYIDPYATALNNAVNWPGWLAVQQAATGIDPVQWLAQQQAYVKANDPAVYDQIMSGATLKGQLYNPWSGSNLTSGAMYGVKPPAGVNVIPATPSAYTGPYIQGGTFVGASADPRTASPNASLPGCAGTSPPPSLPPAPPPAVVNPTPSTQPVDSGSSTTAPASVLNLANGTASATQPAGELIAGIPNWVLWVGGGVGLLLLLGGGNKGGR